MELSTYTHITTIGRYYYTVIIQDIKKTHLDPRKK